MKLKYFLRGLGAGVLFATIIMLAGYLTSDKFKLSDKEIKDRAKKLGMIEATVTDSSVSDDSDTEAITTELTTEATTEEVTTEAPTAETATEEVTTEEASTEEPTTEATTEAATDEEVPQSTIGKKSITITSGMDSETVSKLLAREGIIKDAAAYDAFLNQKGYSTKLEVGTFYFDEGMSDEEIAKIMMKL